jgi:hypothetical protein
MGHMAKSRLHVERLRTRPGTPMDPALKKPERFCLGCGCKMTWNTDPYCCLCEGKRQEEKRDRRIKVNPDNYDELDQLHNLGWKWADIAALVGASSNYLCGLLSEHRRGLR